MTTIITWLLSHHVTTVSSRDYYHITWLLSHHVTTISPHDYYLTTWLLSHHVTTISPHDYYLTTWLLSHHMTTISLHDYYVITRGMWSEANPFKNKSVYLCVLPYHLHGQSLNNIMTYPWSMLPPTNLVFSHIKATMGGGSIKPIFTKHKNLVSLEQSYNKPALWCVCPNQTEFIGLVKMRVALKHILEIQHLCLWFWKIFDSWL